jgi:hypothetical protein
MRYITEGIIEKMNKVLVDTGDMTTLQSSGGNSTEYDVQGSARRKGMMKSVIGLVVTNELFSFKHD